MYRAKKPCKFLKAYAVGDEIPGSEIDETRAGALVKYDIIEIVPETPQIGAEGSDRTNTSPESRPASDGVKTALNSAKTGTEKTAAKKQQARKTTTAKPATSKKGGK